MRISEIRPCDNCGGHLATGSYAIDVSLVVVNPQAVRQVVGLMTMFNGALGLAEAFAPQPDAVVIAGDKEPSLRTRLLIGQSCVMDKPLDIPILLERVNACRVSEADRG